MRVQICRHLWTPMHPHDGFACLLEWRHCGGSVAPVFNNNQLWCADREHSGTPTHWGSLIVCHLQEVGAVLRRHTYPPMRQRSSSWPPHTRCLAWCWSTGVCWVLSCTVHDSA